MRTPYLNPLGIACSALVLLCSIGMSAQNPSSVTPPASRTQGATELPDSPGTTLASLQEPRQSNDAAQAGNTAQSAAPSQNAAPQDQDSQDQKRPVGTAAAEAPKVNGITAAQPAGVAIAPGKQHRVRKLVLRTGAIIGAGAAIGTVIALSAATPSKPPGAH